MKRDNLSLWPKNTRHPNLSIFYFSCELKFFFLLKIFQKNCHKILKDRLCPLCLYLSWRNLVPKNTRHPNLSIFYFSCELKFFFLLKIFQKNCHKILKDRLCPLCLYLSWRNLVPKIGSCEHNKNDLPTHGSVSLKKRIETEHALFSSDILLERWKVPTNFPWYPCDRFGAKLKILCQFWKSDRVNTLQMTFRHSHHKNGTLKSDRLNACFQF